MSDDEYYADSPYDEFEEMLYDADPGPNLADDLAQHTAYSPVWQDDPSGELEPYHSDWEYYSDDYYDDDPAILKNNSVHDASSKTRKTIKTPAKRGRKRKLQETDIALEPAVSQCLKNTIRGTVWAEDQSPKTKIFKTGQQEKVALLIDWRKRPQPEDHVSRPHTHAKLTRDESWANDLSLKDMGLRSVREHAAVEGRMAGKEDEGIIDEDDDDDEAERVSTEGHKAMLEGTLDGGENGDMPLPEDGQVHELEAQRACTEQATLQEQQDFSPRKRLKLSGSQPGRPGDVNTDARHATQNQASHVQQDGVKLSANRQKILSKDVSHKAVDPQPQPRALQKKRKLSFSTQEYSTATQSTTSSRAKRTASSKIGQSTNSSVPSSEPPASSTRSARSRKK